MLREQVGSGEATIAQQREAGDEQAASHEEERAALYAKLRALTDERRGMSESLADYARLEAAWSGEREAAKAKEASLNRKISSLRRKAAKVDDLESKLAESTHAELELARTQLQERTEQVSKERETIGTLMGKIATLENEVIDLKAAAAQGEYSTGARLAEMRAEIRQQQDEAMANDWAAREERERRLEELQANTVMLKEGLARRVMAQMARARTMRCWKAWTTYTMKRQLQRQVNSAALSDDEDAPAAAMVGAPAAAALVGGVFSTLSRMF